MSLHNFHDFTENVQELRNVNFESHLSAFLCDFGNQVNNQSYLVVLDDTTFFFIGDSCTDVLQRVVYDVDERVWILDEDLNLNLLYGLCAEYNQISE